MARFPDLASSSRILQPSILVLMQEKIAAAPKPLIPLHIGDTCLLPPEGALLARMAASDTPSLYRYAHPAGLPELREAIAERLQARGRSSVDAQSIQVTAGATHALALATRATLDPGEEVLVFTPHWPVISGILRSCGAVPVEVPVYEALYASNATGEAATSELIGLVRPYITPRTTALYFTSPNNPDGKLLRREHVEAIARLAREHDLWVIADEVYDEHVFDGLVAPPSIATWPGMLDRTLAAHSFSKSHGLAGLRVGYLVAPPHLVRVVTRLANYSVYNVPVVLQRAALAALRAGDEWQQRKRAHYQAARDLMCATLNARFYKPEGGAYVFADVRSWLSGDPIWALLDKALARGVSMAPGEGFGRAYEGYVRICFTAVDLPDLERAIRILNEILASR